MDNIKLFAKDKKELKILIKRIRIFYHNFVSEKCAMQIRKSGKRKT